MTTRSIIPGCEPMSHVGVGPAGVLVLHGFTGNPSSLREQAVAMADAGHHVEQPLLPGHGTSLDDMLPTRWDDWAAAAADAYRSLAERSDRIVVMGLSMGGALALRTALDAAADGTLRGLVCVNPVVRRHDDETLELLEDMLDAGREVVPAIGSDLADPDAVEIAYDGTPVRALLSLSHDGLAPLPDRLPELEVPLLLFTSRQDHVVEPGHSELLADRYGGPVDHRWLERSFHVATQDLDRDLITSGALGFVAAVTGS